MARRAVAFVVLAGSVALSFAPASRAAPMFVPLGFLPGGSYSIARAVSADGSVVVGEAVTPSQPGGEAFRWTPSGGMVGLGALRAFDTTMSTARGVSADGSIVVGVNSGPAGSVAYSWTQAHGMVRISDVGNVGVYGVSADGSVVVGFGFEHPPGTPVGLAVSGDGSTVVGGTPAYRCAPACLTLDGAGAASQANAVSADGSVVVGANSGSTGGSAFRWTQSGGVKLLDTNPPSTFQFSQAMGVSGDGSIIVGQRDYGVGVWPDGSSREAFIWTSTGGMRSLYDVLVNDYGLDLTGWTLDNALAVSADGNAIVGEGLDPAGNVEAWLAFIPEPGTGALELAGLVLLAASRRVARAALLHTVLVGWRAVGWKDRGPKGDFLR